MTTEDLKQIREVVRDEIKTEIKTALKPVNRKLKKIEHRIELVLKYHDEMYIRQEKRIERIEKHVGLSTPD
jgi:hypothetical protein